MVTQRHDVDTCVSALADALFTSTQQRVLALLFGQPERDFFVTELIAIAGSGRGSVQRVLTRLARSGLAVVSQAGRRKYYRSNPDSPLFHEMCAIVQKTIGVEESIRKALNPLADKLALALLYGSIVRRTDTATSDIDLLLVSDKLTLETVFTTLAPIEKALARRVSPTLYTPDEFRLRRAANSGYLMQVLKNPYIVLIGNFNGI